MASAQASDKNRRSQLYRGMNADGRESGTKEGDWVIGKSGNREIGTSRDLVIGRSGDREIKDPTKSKNMKICTNIPCVRGLS
jgi:hypothetical protein